MASVKPSAACGIYAIVNTLSGRVYIGLTQTTFARRWQMHRRDLRLGSHCNAELQQDWNELGAEHFDFGIVHAYQPNIVAHICLYALEAQIVATAECWLYNAAPTSKDLAVDDLIDMLEPYRLN